jgi:selenocysteine-specific elongation factor
VADNRYFLPATLVALVQVARTLAGQAPDGSFDAAAYRNASQIGRNLTIELLEYFDRSGLTRFAGGRRVMIG